MAAGNLCTLIHSQIAQPLIVACVPGVRFRGAQATRRHRASSAALWTRGQPSQHLVPQRFQLSIMLPRLAQLGHNACAGQGPRQGIDSRAQSRAAGTKHTQDILVIGSPQPSSPGDDRSLLVERQDPRVPLRVAAISHIRQANCRGRWICAQLHGHRPPLVDRPHEMRRRDAHLLCVDGLQRSRGVLAPAT